MVDKEYINLKLTKRELRTILIALDNERTNAGKNNREDEKNMKDSVYVDLRNENKWIRELFLNKDFISVEDLLSKCEDLNDELDHVIEKFEDFKRDVEDNYKRVELSEQLDISDKDFM